MERVEKQRFKEFSKMTYPSLFWRQLTTAVSIPVSCVHGFQPCKRCWDTTYQWHTCGKIIKMIESFYEFTTTYWQYIKTSNMVQKLNLGWQSFVSFLRLVLIWVKIELKIVVIFTREKQGSGPDHLHIRRIFNWSSLKTIKAKGGSNFIIETGYIP